jgi:tRNA 2-thiouridine synthesizing protein A
MTTEMKADKVLDLKGLPCPLPVVKVSQEIPKMAVGQIIEAISTDPGALSDFPAWAASTGHEIVKTDQVGDELRFFIKKTK